MRVLLKPAGQPPRPVAAGAVDVRLVGDGAGQREFSGIAVRILAVLRGQLRVAAVGMGMLRDLAEKLARERRADQQIGNAERDDERQTDLRPQPAPRHSRRLFFVFRMVCRRISRQSFQR